MSSSYKSRGRLSVMLHWVAAGLLAVGASQAKAASVTLCAEPYTQSLPGVANIPMWGYRQAASVAACDADAGVGTASPGPLITVPAGDTTLAITLVNKLTVPTSIVLAAQALPSDGGPPVMAVDLVGADCAPAADPQNCRVRSFTGETAAGSSRTYTFTNLKPGTYLYQSGTHPQVQIQMGLFGMAKQDATLAGSTGRLLYASANAGFDLDVPVVLSEIDTEQHARIAATLGSAVPTTWKAGGNSTLNYAPRFFLINGKVFDSFNPSASDLAISAPAGTRIVLRLANAGLQSRSLMLNSGTWKLLTEDGNPYAAAREQSTALLPANKTSDAMLISTAVGDGSTNRSLAIFDRRGGTDNFDGTSMGGQVARLAITGPVGPSIASINAQVANEGSAFALQILGSNISAYTLTNAPAGMTISAAGLISWPSVPTGTIAPTSYTVSVTGTGAALTTPASGIFNVRINHTPTMAAVAPIAVAHGSVTIAAPGVLAGATDPDGDVPLTAVQTLAASSGTLVLNTNGSYSWTGPQPLTGSTAVSFSVAARDPFGLQSAATAVTLNVAANVAPTAGNDAYVITLARVALPAPLNVPFPVNTAPQVVALTRTISPTLSANDADADGSVVATSITLVPLSARRINPASPVGCTNNCVTIALPAGQVEATVTFNTAAGTFMFSPRRGALAQIPVTGTYEFRYTVRDDQNALSNEAVVRVTVN
jgi:Bacterial Ig domain